MANDTPTPAAPNSPNAPVGEIDHGPSGFEMFLEKNQKLLILLAILITLGIIAFVVMRGLAEKAEKEAGIALMAAESSEDYRSVIADHSGTAAAGTAYVMNAQALWADGKPEEAKETLRNFLANFADHPARAIAQCRLATYLLQGEQLDEASGTFLAATQEDGAAAYNFYSYTSLGDIARAQGQLEAAADYYDRAADSIPAGVFPTGARDAALLRKELLTLDPPELVDPPAPAPEPEIPAAVPDAPPAAVSPPVVVPPVPPVPTADSPVDPAPIEPAPAPVEPAPEPATNE